VLNTDLPTVLLRKEVFQRTTGLSLPMRSQNFEQIICNRYGSNTLIAMPAKGNESTLKIDIAPCEVASGVFAGCLPCPDPLGLRLSVDSSLPRG